MLRLVDRGSTGSTGRLVYITSGYRWARNWSPESQRGNIPLRYRRVMQWKWPLGTATMYSVAIYLRGCCWNLLESYSLWCCQNLIGHDHHWVSALWETLISVIEKKKKEEPQDQKEVLSLPVSPRCTLLISLKLCPLQRMNINRVQLHCNKPWSIDSALKAMN